MLMGLRLAALRAAGAPLLKMARAYGLRPRLWLLYAFDIPSKEDKN